MELLEFKKKMFSLCNVKEVSEISDKLNSVVKKHDTDFFDNYSELVEGEETDWIQALWQYYEADRTEKKQDYTPLSLCELVSAVLDEKDTVYDSCGGSGALTIKAISNGKAKRFYIEELDARVIPFLLFNLCLRNYEGIVSNRDVLTKEVIHNYRLEKGTKYSKCIECGEIKEEICDNAILNPPYNIKWNPPTEIENIIDGRFPIIPNASNANYAFVLNALNRTNNRVVAILPNGITTDSKEADIRKYLVDADLIESVIALPDRMFEATSIPTCLLILNKNKANKGKICFINSSTNCEQEVREQNGQFGSNSHTNRTYKKTINVLSETNIRIILNGLNGEESDISKVIPNETVSKNEYILSPKRYMPINKDTKHRAFEDIVDNINYIKQMKNSCKLVVNETIAKQLGFDIDLYKQKDNWDSLKELGINISKDDYISFTKNKNEMCFKINDKELMPDVMMQFLSIWKNQIALLNTMEGNYLTELRDALLPDLMSGKIKLD